ncbi:TPA: Dam family site-specific DNA-(adenine-N6)-methyltransferase [Salmonella enterica subsp. enterica serovar Paratyphi B]|nr:DNA adenine methylase [Salmonella enterica subsp. enterica serovar Bareilly]EDU8207585.1 Dam family site-specific DNA-(adenine-N6)-methyltransferase [Salmonella enterica subsp. diarizonae]HCM8926087.1 Dam family site-specific DNA-(adenine-N6)-methyltransferase [Salmonella enterica subsp. enterica serovar Paratyphi B]
MPSLPFLKWAGGKRRSLDTLQRWLPSPDEVECLVEPFVGGASVFLGTDYRQYLLADINADLIDVYLHVRDNPSGLVRRLERLFLHGNNETAYRENREEFNRIHAGPEKSALFIYLNQHCFNGICRYNKKGIFNVPFGRRKSAYIPEAEIMAFARKTERCHVSFFHAGFEDTLKMTTTGMFSGMSCAVYCDPPYLPVSQTAGFTTYSGDEFTVADHERLAGCLAELHGRKGMPVVISASDTPLSHRIYGQVGFWLNGHQVSRMVSASAASRKAAGELTGVLMRTRGEC